jgi:hypothetical protein
MAQAMSRIRDLTYLSDRLPTGYQGTGSACVRPEATIYVAGVGQWISPAQPLVSCWARRSSAVVIVGT